MQDYQSPRPGEHRQPGQYLSESERMAQRNKKKQKQRRMLFGGAAAVLIVIVVVIVLIVKGCSGRTDVLAGTWDFDGTTTYSFDGEGSGAMVFPSISYQKAISEIKDRSLYDTGIEPQFKEQLITLSTCFGDSKDSRMVVIGVEQIR